MSSGYSIQLLSNSSSTGDSFLWPGGDGTFSISGNFSGATASLQALCPDGVTWVDCGPNTIMNSPGIGNVSLASTRVRVLLVGGAPTNMDALLARIST